MNQPSNSVLEHYQLIASITSNMLQLAQNNQWPEVMTQCESYIQAVHNLKQLDSLSAQDRQARRELLTQILADDAAIRNLATPEMGRLAHLMGNMKRQQNVLETYYTSHKVPV